MASVNLTTATVSGSIIEGESFEFTISSAQGIDVTITGKDQEGSTDSWFTTNPATITKGSTSVTVTAAQITPPGEYVTYLVAGMNVDDAAHIVVGDSMPARERHERKAS
jgi:hypothetical protein